MSVPFLADESVDFRIVEALRSEGFQLAAIVESAPGISDDEVLNRSMVTEAILLTEDKDFGELTFRLQKPNRGIILIRLGGLPIESQIDTLKKILDRHVDEFVDKFTVITPEKVRIRDPKG